MSVETEKPAPTGSQNAAQDEAGHNSTRRDTRQRTEHLKNRRDARELLATACRAMKTGDFDEAVRCAEELLELAAWERDPAAGLLMRSVLVEWHGPPVR